MHTCGRRAGFDLLSTEQSVEQEGDDAADEGDETGGTGNVLAGASGGLAAERVESTGILRGAWAAAEAVWELAGEVPARGSAEDRQAALSPWRPA